MAFQRDLNFMEGFLGLLLAPRETTRTLLTEQRRSVAPMLFALLFLTLTVPAVVQSYRYGYEINGYLKMLGMFFGVGIVVFILMEWIILLLLSLHTSFRHLFALTSFVLTPVTLALWLTYAFNFAVHGRLTLLSYFLTGYSTFQNSFLAVMPFAILVTALYMGVVFVSALRSLHSLSVGSGIIALAISIVPLTAAVCCGAMAAEIVHPRSIAFFMEIYRRLPALHWPG